MTTKVGLSYPRHLRAHQHSDGTFTAASLSDPPSRGVAVTKSDTVNIVGVPEEGACVHVGTPGHIRVLTAGGSDLTYKNHPVGWLPVRCLRVFATGSDAADIVANW